MDRCDKCGRGPLTLAPEPEGCHRLTRQIAESPPVALADRECAAHAEIATLRARLDAAVERAASAFDLVALIGQTLGAEPGEAALSAAERVRARLDAARLDEAK